MRLKITLHDKRPTYIKDRFMPLLLRPGDAMEVSDTEAPVLLFELERGGILQKVLHVTILPGAQK